MFLDLFLELNYPDHQSNDENVLLILPIICIYSNAYCINLCMTIFSYMYEKVNKIETAEVIY
jgi:hypothetical protein